MRGRKGGRYLPLELRVDPKSCSPAAHQLMWAHADGAVALMAITFALVHAGGDWGSPAELRKTAALLRQAAAHVDRAALVSVARPAPRISDSGTSAIAPAHA